MKLYNFFPKYLMVITGLFFAQCAFSQNSWNTAAGFTGNNYYASLDGVVNSTSGEMTVEFWAKLNTSNGNYSIIGKNQFRIMTSANKIRVQVNGTSLLYSTAKIDSGKWTHVAVTFSDANNAIKIYLNGNLDNTLSTFSGTLAATSDSLIIGKSSYEANLVGELDEVRIWKTVRTQTEIQNNYKTHIGWYSFNYYDANLIFCQTYEFDVFNQGTYFPYGGTHGTFGSDILGDKPSQTVVHNNSLFFTGSSYVESISANDPNVSLTGPVTVEAWIYPTSIGTAQTILDLTQGGSGGYKLTLENTGKISWVMNQIGTGNIVLSANKWYHIAVVCGTPSGGNQIAEIYVNGVKDAGYNFNEMVANTGKLRIGASLTGTNFFNGYIDEVRISNFAKTSGEIQRNLHTPILYLNKPTAPKSTVAYNFDGNIYSGTRLGNILKNTGCRFSYASEPSSPLFHMGYTHDATMDSFRMKHPFAQIPATGSAGFTYDTLHINSKITLDENKIKVFISLNHTLTSDLRAELISPGGDSIQLFEMVNRPSKGITCILNNQSGNLINGTFNDIGPVIGCANHFNVFKGKNSKGIWKLKITDLANGNTGVLNSWGLLVDGIPFSGSATNLKNENKISIFPNPANTKNVTIHLLSAPSEICKVQVLTLSGQVIYEQISESANNFMINLPDATPAGSYFVLVRSGSVQYRSKLIVN